MKCYSCGKEEKVRRRGGELVSDIDMVEVDLAESAVIDDEERYMPLCQRCLRRYLTGGLKGIDKKWQGEPRRLEFVAPPPPDPELGHYPRACPKCGSHEALPISYGYPTPYAEEEARQGKIFLGGCCVRSERLHCKRCGNEW